ncbi:transmembrane protein 145-like isoform X2 [Mya arenaria]|uniref:transmembrane protein 145-like isoform X2 n=1 Tax=Mya arenaria TaxID=6604 RepID=UPI0022E3825C|nr:transmembrane protein 145-like isoform X2 [Mya arenaria]XP_052804007.1 transmembrane protein 145-like isoform X2 [Mya arenaria]
MNNVFLTSVICLFLLTPSCNGKWAEGEIDSLEDWLFITRFCFLSKKGTLQFEFQYPVEYGPQNILLYFDTEDQWAAVYKSGKNCTERESVLKPENNQAIVLLEGHGAGCSRVIIDGVEQYDCSEQRSFRSARERWWYIAVSHCNPQTPVGIKLKYKIHMTNAEVGDYLHREYSADEFYIMPIDVAFLIVYVLLSALVIVCAVFLRNRQLWHTTYKMYMVSVFLWTFYLFLMSMAYGVYGNDGNYEKLQATKYAGRAFEALSTLVFLLMLILMGKGYTITRGKLSSMSTIKISVFMTIYTILYIVVFIWEAIIFDPGLVLYLYESPPGYVMIVMRIIGYAWFCYAIFFTLKHYPEKGSFYHPFFIFFTLWFWAGPIVIIVAMFAIALWSREKTVVGVENFVTLCGHLFFLVLTRPQAANKNFPYHVRTTQIGIMQNVPHQVEGAGGPIGDGSFGGHAYAMSNPMQGSSSGPDLTNLFVTSQTKSVPSGETQLNNNSSRFSQPEPEYTQGGVFNRPNPQVVMPRGRIHSQAQLLPNAEDVDDSYSDFPSAAPSAPPAYQSQSPPSYQDMFTARQSMSS